MATGTLRNAITREDALRLCGEIRQENARKLLGAGKMQCSICYKLGSDNPARLCIFGNERNSGCAQVNKRYDGAVG